jgi:thiol-disulfide isomerase/thioredoxin
MSMVKFSSVLTIIVLLSLLVTFFSGCIDESSNQTQTDDIDYVEDFEFTLLNGEKMMTSEFAGKILMIDFTGVNCPYCVPQMFALEEIYNNFSRDDIAIISINVWIIRGETPQDMANLMEAFRCTSPCEIEKEFSYLSIREYKELFGKQEGLDLNWIFGYDNDGSIFNKYGEGGIPYLLILDKNGNVYYSFVGYTSYSELVTKLNELI